MVYLKFIDIDVYDGGTQNCYDGDSLVVSSADGQNITFCDGANYETEVKMTSRSAIDILFLSDDVMTSSSRGFKAIYSLYYQVETHESCIDDNDVRCSDGRCISLSVWLVDGYDFCGFDTPHEKGFPAFALVGPIVGMLVFFFCSLLASHIKGKCKSTNNEASNQAAVSLQSLNGTTTGEILESAISDNHESTSATVNSDNNDDDGNENEDSSLQSASLGRRNFDFSHSEEMAPPLNDTNQFRSNSPNHRKSILDTPPSYVNVVKIAAPRTVFNYDDDFEDSQSQSSEADNSSIEEQILPPTAPPLENDTCSSTRTDEPPPPSYDDVLRTTDHYLTL
ncbi:uncharacterized protein LOC100374937 [Saccoglossus kowalevskii]|uniref:Uncharacterized protein LOC100374937 n=1 Tax=Saccoglossus kowalevskii TaxID=10224 RepID=A0ABM0GVA0_SACKO|nr:PREDICTED: uncharacterized protein LOC100374937 [Saccoglossus kowalevskii]